MKAKILVVLTVLLTASGCSQKDDSQQAPSSSGTTVKKHSSQSTRQARTRQQEFWDWFEKNSKALLSVKTGREPICAELGIQLTRVKKGLLWLFGPVRDGRREFIVSAGGIREYFAEVKTLVGQAPTFPGWKVIAFRPRSGIKPDSTIEVRGGKLNSRDVYFVASPDGDKVGLTLYIRGLSADNRKWIRRACFLLLDHGLGEHDMEAKIGFLEFKPLPAAELPEGAREIAQIASVIDAKKK